jgi:putative peptide-modifying radical SAM enzyme
MLVSLDGNKERTDLNRGEGTFDLVLQNIQKIRKEGYKGEIVARMTISQDCPDLYNQVLFLLSLIDKKLINSIHWQLDAGFYKYDFNKKEFGKFVSEYNKNIFKLIDFWVKEMYSGRVFVLYPFIAIIESLLKKEKTLIRCGAGHSGYAITTNGKLVACSIMTCIEDLKAGDLESNPNNLKKFSVSGNCENCKYLDLCGGRCLYWNKSNLWLEEGNKLICKTIKVYIDKLKDKLPIIKELIKNKTIKQEDFEYEKYFGPEIIP